MDGFLRAPEEATPGRTKGGADRQRQGFRGGGFGGRRVALRHVGHVSNIELNIQPILWVYHQLGKCPVAPLK